jgi:hypothetical protein
MGHRLLAVAAVTIVLASCAQEVVDVATADAGRLAPSEVGLPNETHSETAAALDFTSCQVAVLRVREWTEKLLLAGATFQTIADLSGPALPSTFPDDRTMEAGENMFDAVEIYMQQAIDLDPLLQSLVTAAGTCQDSDAFVALPEPCSQAVIAALEPERSRASVWLDPGTGYVTTLLDTVSTWLSSGFRLTPNQRAELASAERRALGLHEEMLDEAAYINRLTLSCRI